MTVTNVNPPILVTESEYHSCVTLPSIGDPISSGKEVQPTDNGDSIVVSESQISLNSINITPKMSLSDALFIPTCKPNERNLSLSSVVEPSSNSALQAQDRSISEYNVEEESILQGAIAPLQVVRPTSPPPHFTMVTTPPNVTLQMSTNQPLPTIPVALGFSCTESRFTIPTGSDPVTSMATLDMSQGYSDSNPNHNFMQIASIPGSSGITSLPTPTPSEDDLVKASVAGLHYAIALQAQSVSNVQESILQDAAIPQTVTSPHYTMATTPLNPITTALQVSTHQPISSLQLAHGSHRNDPVSSLPQVEEASEKESRISLVKVSQSQLPVNTISAPNAMNSTQTRTVLVDYRSTQTTSTTNGSGPSNGECTHSTLPATDGVFLSSINRSEAGEAFREHRDDLLIAITESLITANSLYSKRIISRQTLDEIMLVSLTNSKKNFILLDAIEARIRTNPSDFLTVLAVLGRDPHLCVFAERLKNSYCEYINLNNYCNCTYMFHF